MERIGREVRRELGRFGTSAELVDVVRVWPAAVGATVARNAFPARLGRDGTLHVATSSSLWAFELGQLREPFLARLRAQLGDGAPTSLRFAVGSVPEPSSEAARSPRVRPGAEEQRTAARLVATIGDGELRSLVERAVALSLARPSSDRRF